MGVKVQVTQEDIDHGVAGDECDCPVSLAVRRAFPQSKKVHVLAGMRDDYVVEVYVESGPTEFELPLEVNEWITTFDWGNIVEPVEFEMQLRMPDECLDPMEEW